MIIKKPPQVFDSPGGQGLEKITEARRKRDKKREIRNEACLSNELISYF
jgi:hypothetical protein